MGGQASGTVVSLKGTPFEQGAAVLQEIATECNKTVPKTKNRKKKSCKKLGEDKHACCEQKIQEHRDKDPKDGDPPIEGEKGYKRPRLNKAKNKPVKYAGKYPKPKPTNSPRPDFSAAFGMPSGDARRAAIGAAYKAARGNCYPDAAILNSANPAQKTFVDFKFPCPKGHPSGKGKSKGGVKTTMGPKQQASYDSLGQGSGGLPAVTINP